MKDFDLKTAIKDYINSSPYTKQKLTPKERTALVKGIMSTIDTELTKVLNTCIVYPKKSKEEYKEIAKKRKETIKNLVD